MAVNYNTSLVADTPLLYLDGANPKSYSTAQNLITNSDAKGASGTTMPTSWNVIQRMGEAYDGQEAAFPSNMSSGVDTNGYGYFKFDVIGTTRSGNLMVLGTDNNRNWYLKRNTTYTISYNYNLPSSFLNASLGLGIFFAPQYYTAAGVLINTPASNIQANQRLAGLNRTTFTFTTPDADIGFALPRFQFGSYAPAPGPVDYRDFYLGGVQLEQGSSATTYTPTSQNTIRAHPQASEAIVPGVWQDLSPNKIPYSVQNFSANTAAYQNGYVSFTPESYNSNSTYFQIRDLRIHDLTTNLTVETCVYLIGNAIGDTQLQSGRIVSSRYQEQGAPWGFRVIPNRTASTGGIQYEINTNIGWFTGEDPYIPTSVIDNHKWVYVTQVQDDTAKTLKTYVNGVLRGTLSYTGTPNSGGGINIGRGYFAGTRNASGRVSFLRIYNRPFSDAEVLQNYNAMRGRFTPPPLIVDSSLKLWLDAGNLASYPGSGTAWIDLSGTGNNGTLVGNPTFNSANGGSIVFTPSASDYVNLTSASLLPTGTSDRTIIAFVRTPTSFPYNFLHVIHWGTASTDQAFGMAVLSTGGLSSHTWGAGPSQGTLSTGTIYCLAITYTHASTLHRFWINGVSQGAGVARSINTGTTTARVGSRIQTPAEQWGPDGRIYNVMVYNRALSEQEIQQNFNALRERFGI